MRASDRVSDPAAAPPGAGVTGCAGRGPARPPARLIALIGFMAAGKSTVGARLARSLGWRFIDVDREIERRTGRSIPDLFRDPGEPAFRALESELTAALLTEDHAVLALGGGWAAQPGALESVPPAARTVWLRVSAAEAERRAAAAPAARPLLAGVEPGAAAALLRRREAAYGRADFHVEVDHRTPEEIVLEIQRLLTID